MLSEEEFAELVKREERLKESVNEFAHRMVERFGEKHFELIRSTIQKWLDDCGDGVPADPPFDRIVVEIAKQTGAG